MRYTASVVLATIAAGLPAAAPLTQHDPHLRPGVNGVLTSHRTGHKTTFVVGPQGEWQPDTLEPGTYTLSLDQSGSVPVPHSHVCVDPVSGRGTSGPLPRTGRPIRISTAPYPQTLATIDRLASAEIAEAIALGQKGPRVSAHPLATPGRLIGTRRTTGRLWTPFDRVIAMAAGAPSTQQPLASSDIPPAVLERLVWIAAGPASHYIDTWGDMDSPEFLTTAAITIRRGHENTQYAGVQPAWQVAIRTACEASMFERLLGERVQIYTSVGAFPVDHFEAGGTIVFTYGRAAVTVPGSRYESLEVSPDVRVVAIRETDLRRWRLIK